MQFGVEGTFQRWARAITTGCMLHLKPARECMGAMAHAASTDSVFQEVHVVADDLGYAAVRDDRIVRVPRSG